MTGLNYINPDADLDDLIDKMLANEKSNPTRQAQLEKERQDMLNKLKEEQEAHMNEILGEEY